MRLEILHGLDLPLGVTAADGDDGHADPLGAVVQAQPAGEHAVGHHVLEHVAVRGPGPDDAPGQQVRPVLDVVPREIDHRRDPRRAAGRMNPQDFLHLHGHETFGKAQPQIVLRGVGDALEVLQTPHVLGRVDAHLRQLLLVERRLESPCHRLLQSLQLNLLDAAALGRLNLFVPERCVDHRISDGRFRLVD